MTGLTVTSLLLAMALSGPPTDPEYIQGELRAQRTERPAGLEAMDQAGDAVFDPSSNGWFATVNGVLVRIGPDGRLPRVLDDVQGRDFDVRLAAGVAISREPGDRIVVHRIGSDSTRSVVLKGSGYFHPRLSPDGRFAIVHESRAEGSRIWLVDLAGETSRVLANGVAGAWHPDGKRVVFARVQHDSRRILSSTLFEVSLEGGVVRSLSAKAGTAPVEPAVSEDGSRIAFVDAFTDQVHEVAYLPGKEVTDAP